jgi:hypothetical protein
MDDQICNLCVQWDKKVFLDGQKYPAASELARQFPDTYRWHEYDLELGKLLNNNILINKLINRKIEENGRIQAIRVYLCYNWTLKTEFVLLEEDFLQKHRQYSPQYGRDDNYYYYTQTEFNRLAFSPDAFKRERPDLAGCLNSI